ncbi:COP9 signalosome complex subunit 3-like [Oscarella lobularis]|uniref:COP9 signalosome complex subunit 3-like n=1 Tax=Oscarella lobularis TaxID=121494 RepID=UPI0033136185
MATTLDQYVSRVRAHSDAKKFAELAEMVRNSREMLSKNMAHVANALESFDAELHTLGVLGILYAKSTLPSIPDVDGFLTQIQTFVRVCATPQISHATDLYCSLCHCYTKLILGLKHPIKGIETLKLAVEKLRPTPNHLTSIHADLAQVCLLSKCFKPVLPFLECDIGDFVQEGNGFDVKMLLLYYYYGGMIYTGIKQFDKALFFFEAAVTTPAQAVSAIMLEAYKKYILVSLLLHGKVHALPRYTSGVVGRYLKPLCAPYNELTTAYSTNSAAEVQKVVTKHKDAFIKDTNMGLVKQVVASRNRKNIQMLTKTFLTLSLADMASRVQLSSPKEAEKCILHMIEDGEIFATIDHQNGMVSFRDKPETFADEKMVAMVDSEIHRCMELTKRIQKMDRDMAVNPQYVKKTLGVQSDDDLALSVTGSHSMESYAM